MRQSSLAKFGIVSSKSKTGDAKNTPDSNEEEGKSSKKKDVGGAASQNSQKGIMPAVDEARTRVQAVKTKAQQNADVKKKQEKGSIGQQESSDRPARGQEA